MTYESRFPIFAVAADIVVLTLRDDRLCVLLVRRAGEVFTGRWALPGGFVRIEESLEQAAYRELGEEAGIGADAVVLEQLRTYGDPGRDPRPERVVSVAWLALGAGLPQPTPDTDADRAEWVPVDEAFGRELAFDHDRILRDGIERARSKLEYTTVATAFCGRTFTLPELRRVYEAVWDAEVDPRNFQRKVLGADGFVEETGDVVHGRGRPAKVYRSGPADTLYPPVMRR
ncbi:NUDIX hydrolase [Raineyella sp. LH-20]|uniref:NUDIX hydrolase n=1 Tax=Raineyella sp. LH-20 TaxID=3081204 RepID=UPI0029548352|nr:NUDIX domain-containing protein [Raineyella sp. LH-20]WOP18273.1 NUDIX domain-containing protein [Raineyella sp. LH-20]